MKPKWAIFAVITAFFALSMLSDSNAVNTRDIDTVRNKPVLESADLQVIDDFLNEAVRELTNTRDFSSIAKTRSIILARNESKKTSAQAQYTEQFSQSALKHISAAFKDAEQLTPDARKFKATLNLLILIDRLEDIKLADLSLTFLQNQNKH